MIIEKDINPLICPNYGYLGAEAVQIPEPQIYCSDPGQLTLQTTFFDSLLEVLQECHMQVYFL